MTDLLWWHWAIIGFGFVLSELLVPAFVLVWFGLGGLLVMIALLLFPAMALAAQLLLWTITSLLMVLLWFRIFKRNYHKVLVGRASAHLEGEVGLLTEPVAPFKNGKVRFQRPVVGSDLWDCVADEEINAGTRVKVVRVEGNVVTVAKA